MVCLTVIEVRYIPWKVIFFYYLVDYMLIMEKIEKYIQNFIMQA